MPFDEPNRVVSVPELDQRLTELLDGSEAADPEQALLKRAMKRPAQPLPLGARTKAGELSMPKRASSSWKASDMYLLDLAERRRRLPAPDLARAARRRASPRSRWQPKGCSTAG